MKATAANNVKALDTRNRPRAAPAARLGLAFLGGAINSAVGRVHRTAIEMDRRYELRAGCFSRNEDINATTGAEYGLDADSVYRNLDDMLAREAGNIDAAVILTPTHQHKEQVLACLSAGVPVICEKALADFSADIEEIRDLLIRRDGFLAVTFNYTGYPMLRELRHMVQTGRLGTLEQIHIEMPLEGFARVEDNGKPVIPQDWRLLDIQVPTVSLDLGVHTHSIVRFLTGQSPLELSAMSNTYGNFRQIVDSISCIARYSGNLSCSMWYGKAALGCRNGLKVRLFGSEGAAEWVQENPEYVMLADNHGRRWILDRASPDAQIANMPRYTRFKAGHPAGFIEGFANYYYDIAESLTAHLQDQPDKNPYVFGAEDALEGLHMLEAIASSSSGKNWVEVDGSPLKNPQHRP